jgi:hypothetical protein
MTVGAQARKRARTSRALGEQPVRERIVDEERRHCQHVRIARVLDPIALKRAQVVSIAQLRT